MKCLWPGYQRPACLKLWELLHKRIVVLVAVWPHVHNTVAAFNVEIMLGKAYTCSYQTFRQSDYIMALELNK